MAESPPPIPPADLEALLQGELSKNGPERLWLEPEVSANDETHPIGSQNRAWEDFDLWEHPLSPRYIRADLVQAEITRFREKAGAAAGILQAYLDAQHSLRAEIEALRAENAELKEALTQIATATHVIGGEGPGPLYIVGVNAGLKHLSDIARAALQRVTDNAG
jgi:hypothetical protein